MAQVGHLERFNPAVRATLPLITRPMFFEVHRLSVFSPRALDVDVVLDLMIHDLDVVLTFVKSEVKEIRAVGLPVLSGKVDIANVRIEFESGCVANFTASRVSTERVRKLRFFQPGQYISIDYGRQDVLVFSVGSPFVDGQPTVNPQIPMAKPAITAEEPLLAEINAFLESVRSRSVRWFRWRMDGGRWSWGWRFWRRSRGMRDGLEFDGSGGSANNSMVVPSRFIANWDSSSIADRRAYGRRRATMSSNSYEVIPIVSSQVPINRGHPVIGSSVRRSPNACPPCAYKCISTGTPAFLSAM